MPKELRVALIGYGFMGRTHSNAYHRVNDFFDLPYRPVLKCICGLVREEAEAFAKQWSYESADTDWKKVIARDDIDLVDICLPNFLHAQVAAAAAEAGKMIICEKPLALNSAQGEQMCQAVEKAGVPNMISFNYRRIPAVALAKQLVDDGRMGQIFHYRANFLQDWTISAKVPQGGMATWRLDAAAAGSGVTGDLLAHCFDTALWINGPITSLCATTETFVKERLHAETGKKEPVTIDDAAIVMCRFANGSLGVFESTRYARGHKALYTFEINGANASIKWDLHDLHRLQYFDHRDESIVRGWRNIHVTDSDMPYMKHWWVPGLQIGFEHSFVHQLADFLEAVGKGERPTPSFRDALATQRVCDAVLASGKSGQWIEIPA